MNSFNDGEQNEILRWKDLSFNVLYQILELPVVFHKSVVLAGGVYTSWHHKEKIKDIDVFILDTGDQDTILQYLAAKTGDIFITGTFKDASQYKRDNKNITDVYNAKHKITNVSFQFIFTKYKTRQELIHHFDYLHCTPNYYNSNLFVRKDAFEAIRDKRLVVHNKDNQTEWRRDKFIKHRGFKEDSPNFKPWVNYRTNIAGGGTWSSTAGAGGGGGGSIMNTRTIPIVWTK